VCTGGIVVCVSWLRAVRWGGRLVVPVVQLFGIPVQYEHRREPYHTSTDDATHGHRVPRLCRLEYLYRRIPECTEHQAHEKREGRGPVPFQCGTDDKRDGEQPDDSTGDEHGHDGSGIDERGACPRSTMLSMNLLSEAVM